MPWNAGDAPKFKSGLSRKQRRKWAAVANGALASCVDGGGTEKDCAGKAVRIANSKFMEFNPVIKGYEADLIMAETYEPPESGDAPKDVKDILRNSYSSCRKSNPDYSKERCAKIAWGAVGNAGWSKNKEDRWVKNNSSKIQHKKFQHRKNTPPDAIDGHVHEAVYDEDGNGATTVVDDHHHMIFGFKIQNYYYFDQETKEEYSSVHPGSLAFQKKEGTRFESEESELGECEMEIFRTGTHNGDEFTDKNLEEIAENFGKLRNEVRPKLKITHRENQESLAGLMSYGDVVEVFLKKIEDGTKRLFAKITNVPKKILDLIKDRRFPERSIEIYPEFKLGTNDDEPIYRNVLKAVALLGHEMPAVTGMEPVQLAEHLECQGTICFKEICECEECPDRARIPQGIALAIRMLRSENKEFTERLRREEVKI